MLKHKNFSLGRVILVLVLVPGVVFAAGTDVQFTADTLLNLSGTGINLTVAAGSKVESYVVGTTSVTLTLNAGSYLDLRSTDYRALTNDTFTYYCAQGYSHIIASNISSQMTFTVTPGSTDICRGGGSGTVVPLPTTPTIGNTAGHPSGTLVNDNGTIYLIKDGKRLGFRNPQEYNSHGFNFSQAVPATDADRALPIDTSVAKALEGTLVLDASDNRTVYMIGVNGSKRGFTSESVFKSLGYSFANLPKIDLSDYPASGPVDSAIAPHPEGALVLDKNDNRTVWWVKANMRMGFESAAVFNTYGFDFKKIVPANTADMELPTGGLVKFRDGTLVKDGADYYLISDGKKLKFASTSALTNLGYKITNVIQATLSTYSAGAMLE